MFWDHEFKTYYLDGALTNEEYRNRLVLKLEPQDKPKDHSTQNTVRSEDK